MDRINREYEYSGPVMAFDRCIDQYWTATTFASSKRKALSNLAYRYKTDNNLIPNVRIELPGKLVKKGE